MDDKMLDALFDAARRDTATAPSTDLMARVLADATSMQPSGKAQIAQPVRAGFWATLLRNLGGWPSVAGLATAAAAGVWIGVIGSSSLIGNELGTQVLGGGQSAVLSDFDTSYAFLLE